MAKANKIRRIGLVGAGLIGAGWAARCLANGLDVVATDPAPNAEAKLRATVANAIRLLDLPAQVQQIELAFGQIDARALRAELGLLVGIVGRSDVDR